MNSKKLLSTIIVNYNVTRLIEECIYSLIDQKINDKIDIIVIDNASPDRSIETLKTKYPEVTFTFLDENIGFSKANNFAALNLNSDYILFLNPDTIIIEDFVTPMLQFMEDQNTVGICAPMLVYANGDFQNSCGPKIGFLYECAEAFMFISLYRKIYNRLKGITSGKVKSISVDWVSAACLLIRSDVFKFVGGYSEEFFMNYEDIDLCLKVNQQGYDVLYCPQYKCVHLDQSSQKRDYTKLVLSRYQSRLIYSKKNYTAFMSFIVRIIHIFGILLRLFLVSIIYSGSEKYQRKSGYMQSLFIYLGGSSQK